jgi:hypothetical protein
MVLAELNSRVCFPRRARSVRDRYLFRIAHHFLDQRDKFGREKARQRRRGNIPSRLEKGEPPKTRPRSRRGVGHKIS